MIVKVMRIICIADDVNEDDDTFEGIGWICKSGQRQDCPHSSSQAAALSTWKTLHCMFKGSLYLFPVSISSIENISWIVKALNCPWPFVNTERRARASWRELLEVPAPSNKLVKIWKLPELPPPFLQDRRSKAPSELLTVARDLPGPEHTLASFMIFKELREKMRKRNWRWPAWVSLVTV